MAHRPTLSDLAQAAGVSLATASRAINGSATRTVRPELRQRVLQAAEELGYTPDANAQGMARRSTLSVGLIVHDVSDPYFSSISAAVTEAVDAAGMHVILVSTQHDPDREAALVDHLHRLRARSIVVVGGRRGDAQQRRRFSDALERYRRAAGRAVVVGHELPGYDSVVIDNERGAADLARALFGRGYRRAAVLSGPLDHSIATARRDAFVAAFREAGGHVRAEDVHPGPFTWEGGAHAMAAALAGDPEVVFAVNDVMALGALAAAREQGIDVPGDVALAGFDDITHLRDVVPALSTVHVPLGEVGAAAAELALSPDAEAPRRRDIVTRVVLRDTTPERWWGTPAR